LTKSLWLALISDIQNDGQHEKQSKLTIEQLSSMPLIIEFHGKIKSLSGEHYATIA
jgi:hypothetical protein